MSIMLAPIVTPIITGVGWLFYQLGASILDSPVILCVAVLVVLMLGGLACFIEEVKEDCHHPYHTYSTHATKKEVGLRLD
jgi:hypothetical protein